MANPAREMTVVMTAGIEARPSSLVPDDSIILAQIGLRERINGFLVRREGAGRENLYFFISYRYEDRHLAGRVGQLLKGYQHDFFLAHEDINPSDDFEDRIKEEIEACTALIATVTPNFAEAAYPNQEVGMAIGMNKPIIPLWFPDVKPSKLGFLKAVNAIHTSETELTNAILKAVEFAEQKIEDTFAGSLEPGPIEEMMDARLGSRRETYYRVLVRPQGLYELIPQNAENDEWLISNKPPRLTYMNGKATQSGVEFRHPPDPYFGEVQSTGLICFGQAVPREDGVVLEAFIRIVGEWIEYGRKVYEKYGWNQQQNGLVRIEFKIGQSRKQALRTWNPSELNGRYITDYDEVKAEEAVPLESLAEPSPVLTRILMKTCRGFGISMSEKVARDWVIRSRKG